MERYDVYLLVLGRVLISVVFILNALGIIDQSIPAHEMVERGAPPSLVPAMMMAGRAVELLAGLAHLGSLPAPCSFGALRVSRAGDTHFPLFLALCRNTCVHGPTH